MGTVTWNEICNMADGAACGEPALRTKDEARWQVREFVSAIGCSDPDGDEVPEDTIERYCNCMDIRFDENGNIIGLKLPDWAEGIIYRRVNDDYLENDLRRTVQDLKGNVEISEKQMQRMVALYRRNEDCNVAINDTLESVIRQVFEDESFRMTVRDCIKKNGWQVEYNIPEYLTKCNRMTVDIGFVDEKGKDDETEFDIELYNIEELENLFSDFCKENQLPNDTVTYVAIVSIDYVSDGD